uniref:Uncharacterized protein n=1 Tax=Lutzomyia longipalpis TaxID=7200 RepID=A0A1B0GK05_LUTLO
ANFSCFVCFFFKSSLNFRIKLIQKTRNSRANETRKMDELFTPISSYVQGQSPEKNIREYFILLITKEGRANETRKMDELFTPILIIRTRTITGKKHPGILLLYRSRRKDDARMKNFTSCFKDKKFLHFFFTRVRLNNTDRYSGSFPYLSPCGRERNFIRCDDLPIVYTHTMEDGMKLSYNHAGDLLTVPFQPDKIFMSPDTGRVYHPAIERYGSIGLIRSKLAIEFGKNFDFQDGEAQPPTHFTWKGTKFELDREWVSKTILLQRSL